MRVNIMKMLTLTMTTRQKRSVLIIYFCIVFSLVHKVNLNLSYLILTIFFDRIKYKLFFEKILSFYLFSLSTKDYSRIFVERVVKLKGKMWNILNRDENLVSGQSGLILSTEVIHNLACGNTEVRGFFHGNF